MNAFSRMGRTCASVVLGGFLAVGAMFAATPSAVTVNLPHAVTVGSTTLPSGQYTMTPVAMMDGNPYFIVRGDKTPTVTIPAQRIEAAGDSKTSVVLSKDGETWRFDRLFIDGDQSGYEFAK